MAKLHLDEESYFIGEMVDGLKEGKGNIERTNGVVL